MPRLMWLPGALRNEGLDVVTVAGWELRGSEHVVPRVVVNHHTVSRPGSDAPSLRVVRDGRPGIPGPLCNILVARSGRVFVIASGVSNNAGRGGWKPFGADRNSHTIGVETENNGTGEPWHHNTYEAKVLVNAAICRHYDWSVDRCIAHKEWAPTRKIDPNFDMGHFRAQIAARLEVDDLTPEQERKLNELWTAFIGHQPREEGGVHNLAYPILSTNHGVGLLLAAANQGGDPKVIAEAVIDQLGRDLSRDLMHAIGEALSHSG